MQHMSQWLVAALALGYASFLYFIAHQADRRALIGMMTGPRPVTYALGLAVFCTSWTFYGSVGMASERGLDFLTIYIGPVLVFLFGYRLLERIVTVGRNERTSSTADFIAARYGKSYGVALVATLIMVIGIIPYIALQLQAIASSFQLLTGGVIETSQQAARASHDTTVALPIALALAVFAILFGTRHADATEHQDGMFVAIAFESIVKFTAFFVVGAYALFLYGDGAGALFSAIGAADAADSKSVLTQTSDIGTLATLTLLSGLAIILLPREFHMMVVENRDISELRVARWFFPLYLVGINLFVLPVAYAGLSEVGPLVNPDLYVIAVPLVRDNPSMAAIAFIGGLSAATAMVIVACVALAIMISNHIVLPFFISKQQAVSQDEFGDWGGLILQVRRAAITCVMLLGYLYYQASTQTQQLSQIGLLSFAAIAQLAPAFIGGLYWRNANARGAVFGMVAGFSAWVALLLYPALWGKSLALSMGSEGASLPILGGLWPMSETAGPFVSGTLASLAINFGFFVFGSLSRAPTPFERVQASVFIPDPQAGASSISFMRVRVTIAELRSTVASYLGEDLTRNSFEEHFRKLGIDPRNDQLADAQLVRFAEQLLGRAVGSASARLILSLLTERRNAESPKTIQLLGEASEALQHNRGLLMTALDQVAQGICILDDDFRLAFWNRRLFDLLDLPDRLQHVGVPLRDLTGALVQTGFLPQRDAKKFLSQLSRPGSTLRMTQDASGRVIEIQTSRMPAEGLVATVSDVTDTVRSAEALQRSNEELEHRVARRTAELIEANEELARARMRADHANAGKTRFLAAAGHDILQPLNAARLYTAAMLEDRAGAERFPTVKNVDAALASVESILGAVLEISKLDAGAMKTRIAPFPANRLLDSLRSDFSPVAAEKGLELTVMPSRLMLNSDRDLLRRLVQNLVSNAVKYTRTGRILVGVRRRGEDAVIEVIDTGIGMSEQEQQRAFQEFTRLDSGVRQAGGLGLGLSIVDRIVTVLGLQLAVQSSPGAGTRMMLTVPRAEGLEASAAEALAAPQLAPAPLSGTLVLCVDNEPAILDGLSALLQRWGCTVLTAPDGAAAEEALRRNGGTPSIAFVDYHLDHETGLDVIAALRAENRPWLKACLVTADRTPALARQAADMGVDILNKPVKPAALRALINEASTAALAAE
jgi:Na+/proline symporter/signal transduction histidine kinase/ActR/RegA family two-component response regulator